MRIVVIGATGHIGGYLVPRLVKSGHDVFALSRGLREPYRQDPSWQLVTRIVVDRESEAANGEFGPRVAALNPDVVIDLVCFAPEEAEELVVGIRGHASLLISCGTIWVHGSLTETPADEDADLSPWGEYGVSKLKIERFLSAESKAPNGLPSVTLRPGHISGPGWAVINPAGNTDLSVWEKLAQGQELVLPNFGLETVHHVHADDVAQAFERCVERGREVAGHSFHITSDHALTLRGFATAVAGWFGREPNLSFVPFEEFAHSTTPEHAATSYEHVARSHSISIDRARSILGYLPRYSSLDAVREAVVWLHRNGRVNLGENAFIEKQSANSAGAR
jgi:nucleoside-diphosphate-sugar epimerase